MTMSTGWYSLIQVCPDFARAETVNVGIYLFCTEPHTATVLLTHDFRRAGSLLKHTGVELAAVKESASRIARRLESARFQSVEEFEQFARSRGNALQLTSPRSIRVDDPDRVARALMDELVAPVVDLHESREALTRIPVLHDAFVRLSLEQPGRVTLEPRFDVPELGMHLGSDYAYTNGRVNMVDVIDVPRNASASERRALELNSRGEAVAKYVDGGRARLTIVAVDSGRGDTEASRVFDKILTALHGSELVHEADISRFVERVEREVRERH